MILAALIGAALCTLGSPSPPWHAIARGIVLETVAAGVMTALKYAGDHVGTALGCALTLTRPRYGELRTYVGPGPGEPLGRGARRPRSPPKRAGEQALT